MTKEEARKMLEGTKVYVNGRSEEIQKKLFEIGFKWDSERFLDNPTIKHTQVPFLYISSVLTQDSSMLYFKEHPNKEVSAEEILDILIDKEVYIPEPFTQVLGRSCVGGQWRPDIFLFYEDKYYHPYVCANNGHKQCIPYKGNEHLNGKTDDK